MRDQRSASTRAQVVELVQAALVWNPRATIIVQQVRAGRWIVEVQAATIVDATPAEAPVGPQEPAGDIVEP